jgi:Mlc titration factor MtfA (ptsG expression regulator)
VQLTFGLPDYSLPHFRRVIVVPDKFKSPITGKNNRGEVNPTGVIFLSWKHLAEGVADPMDGVSLGLHELAHAVYLENFIPNEEDDFFSAKQLAVWRGVAEETLDEIRNQRQSFLRDYAGTNLDELFAVSVEYFFEQPDAFSQSHPQLYAALSALLNLDPRRAGNPVLDFEVVLDIDGD